MKRYLAVFLALIVVSPMSYGANNDKAGKSEKEFIEVWLDRYLYACKSDRTAVLARNPDWYFRISFSNFVEGGGTMRELHVKTAKS